MVKNKMKEIYIAPIHINVHDFKRSISIGKLKIRKITSEEQRKFFGIYDLKYTDNGDLVGFISITQSNSDFNLRNFPEKFKLYSCQHVVEYTNRDVLVKELSTLLLAFRLYQEGNVFAPLVFYTNTEPLNFIYPQFTNETKKYAISTKEFWRIKKIVTLINNNKSLHLAFERFNNALSNKTNEKNSFIDFVTILESIFLENSGNQELSFRFSLYTSYILKNKLKTATSFKEMQEIYTVRSKLVHSGTSNKYSKELYEKTKKYTRLLLLWTLENSSLKGNEYKKMILEHLNLNP